MLIDSYMTYRFLVECSLAFKFLHIFYCPLVFQLVLEGLHSKQTNDLLLMEKGSLLKKIQLGNVFREFFEKKAAKIEDQVEFIMFV